MGSEIARQLAQGGVAVIIGAREDERGNAAASNFSSQGFDATSV